jgi:hypothetical protein
MKTFAAAFAILFTLCGPALADSGPPARSESFKVRFTLHDAATTRTFDVVVGAASPCASASEKLPDHEVDLHACVSAGSRLDITWFNRSSSGEYRSSSSLPLVHGTTAELGATNGPRLAVEVQ